MTYRLFLETTKACIKNYLPESYQTKEAVIEPVIKNNSVVLQGFSMRDGKAGRAEPVLYLEPFYKAYQNGKELEDVWMELAVRYDAAQKEIQTVSISMEYEKVKNGLFVSVCNAAQNAQRLQGIPHDIREDLALTYQCRVRLYDGQMGDMLINNRHLSHWGITGGQLRSDAWSSMKKVTPPVFLTMNEMIERMKASDSTVNFLGEKAGPIGEIEKNASMYVLTNTEADFGAAYMFDDDVMSAIAERLDSDLLVLPSSVHETLILKEQGILEVCALRQMVEEVNKDVVAPEVRLSDEIYRYDRAAHSLRMLRSLDYHQSWQFTMG